MGEQCDRHLQDARSGVKNTCDIDLKHLLPELKAASARINVSNNGVFAGHGSGVVICDADKKDCVVLTNNHVVKEGTQYKIEMTELPGAPTSKGKVAAVDEFNDLAIIVPDTQKLFSPKSKNIVFAEDKPEKGDSAVALGHPYGVKRLKISPGKITNPTDQIFITDANGKATIPGQITIESDSLVFPGNSGSGYFSKKGGLLGLIVETSITGVPGEQRAWIVPGEYAVKLLEKYRAERKAAKAP